MPNVDIKDENNESVRGGSMKLISEILEHRYNSFDLPDEHCNLIKDLLPGIRNLESDSQLLDDLIEMMMAHKCSMTRCDYGIVGQERHTQYSISVEKAHMDMDQYNGATPREAIAAAIKEWKKHKNETSATLSDTQEKQWIKN